MSSNFGFLQELLTTVADTSRTLLPKRLFTEAEGQRGLQALVDALTRAVTLYADTSTWQQAVKRAMQSDFSWEQTSKKYLEIYARLIRAS